MALIDAAAALSAEVRALTGAVRRFGDAAKSLTDPVDRLEFTLARDRLEVGIDDLISRRRAGS